MKGIWEEPCTVRSFDVDYSRKLKLNALFNYFQQIAHNHAEHLGWGYEALQKKGFFWILSRIKINVIKYPLWMEDIFIQTWPKGVEKLFAMRDFLILDKDKNPMVEATSAWILYDMKASRPARVDKFFKDPDLFINKHAVKEIPDKLEASDRFQTVLEKHVRYSDIDVNDHVNNTRYLEWIQDSFEKIEYEKQSIKSLQVNFLKEVRYGETILVKRSGSKNNAFIQMENIEDASVILQSLLKWD
ncbi:MAG: hypothetical protein JW827_11280 [Spirochaetes bacterium]|nr:hypothetical protein [Spirochaetota bacterium]